MTPDGVAASVHLFGLVLTLWLGSRLRQAGTLLSAPQRRAILVFTSAWLVLFASSSAFHLAPQGQVRDALALADNSAIALAIAAAWTPLGPFRLPPMQAHRMLAITWGLAVIVLAAGAAAAGSGRLGWFQREVAWAYFLQAVTPALLHGRAILQGYSWPLLMLLTASLLAYGGGMLLYQRPDLTWAHAGWHVAVLAGCLCNHAGLARLIAEARSR